MLSLSRSSQRFSAPLRARLVSSRTAAATKLCCCTPHSAWRQYGIRRLSSSALTRDDTTGDAVLPPPIQDVPLERQAVDKFVKSLPVVCPGCGAMSQTLEPETPGFYSPRRRNMKKVKDEMKESKKREEEVYWQAMARLSATEESAAEGKVAVQPEPEPSTEQPPTPPICDRCHDLIHRSKGISILHPSMQSIQSIIESSPHKHNHIYHVLDAADFPMSLIPNLMSALDLPRLRTQNRRSKSRSHIGGRVAEVSFIITRSDLLTPQKEQVDRMMPYLQEVLRDALGRNGKNLRLGNVRCVSAKRGWWTPHVKKDIWKRGGAGWVVGKVNVGKSALFEVVFPKGRDHVAEEAQFRDRRVGEVADPEESVEDEIVSEQDTAMAGRPEQVPMTAQDPELDIVNAALKAGESDVVDQAASDKPQEGETYKPIANEANREPDLVVEEEFAFDDATSERRLTDEDPEWEDEEEASLLPPAQPEMQYPQMPIVSSLPGTTASPIRIPFGNGKGELIDLPGVQRSSLETHVEPEHRQSLVMKSRVVPDQYTIKPGQSLLIGGVIRITPKTDEIFLAYPFTPLKAHATGTSKAVAIQTGVQEDGTPYTGTVESIATEKAKSRIKSAGTFKLAWDVTKRRAGPVTDKTAGKQKAENLPYIVYGADILIEGVGWVELVCQVRKRKESLITDALSAEPGENHFSPLDTRPEVEVFTPNGKFIGIRQPMNAWLTGGPKTVAKHAQRSRPRMTISMQKRKEGGRKGGQEGRYIPG